MPNQSKFAGKQFRSRPPESLTVRQRRALSKLPSTYRDLFGDRFVGYPITSNPERHLRSRGNRADKIMAERRALAVLRYLHGEELVSLYEEELDFIEAGGGE